jgi:hypothetical protein
VTLFGAADRYEVNDSGRALVRRIKNPAEAGHWQAEGSGFRQQKTSAGAFVLGRAENNALRGMQLREEL